ncbi:MAG: hypothetical protein M1827_006510 [Pycnora praestabilis]|nr:MAG: hypothetical protein M1827_006510 [Pycnora praestabilis]
MPIPIQTNEEKPSNSTSLPATSNEASSDTPVHQATAAFTGPDHPSRSSSAAQHSKSEVEKAADQLYEERMEDEYAKREGGA